MVTVRFKDGKEASIDYFKWTSEDKDLEIMLNAIRNPMYNSPAYNDPDFEVATDVIKALGGDIIHHDAPEPTVPGRIYHQ